MSDLSDLLRKPVLPAFIKLFSIDLTPIGLPNIFHYTPMTTAGLTTVHWNGVAFEPFPIDITGLERTTSGAPPRAELHIANIISPRLFGTLASLYGDIIGAEVTYRKTFECYLNTSISAPPLMMRVSRKISENRKGISFELQSPLDDDRAWLPARQMLKVDFPGLGINKGVSR
jgi:lambda family phage minor tail protein L